MGKLIIESGVRVQAMPGHRNSFPGEILGPANSRGYIPVHNFIDGHTYELYPSELTHSCSGYSIRYRVLRDIQPGEYTWGYPYKGVVKAGAELWVTRWDSVRTDGKLYTTEDVGGYKNPGEITVLGSPPGWNTRPISGVPADAIERIYEGE